MPYLQLLNWNMIRIALTQRDSVMKLPAAVVDGGSLPMLSPSLELGTGFPQSSAPEALFPEAECAIEGIKSRTT